MALTLSMTPADPSLEQTFSDNAETYDRVNSVISLGLDSRWRRWAAGQAVFKPHANVLDAFAGTGLVGMEAARLGANVTLADASPEMLSVARRRARERDLRVEPVLLDFTVPLPFEDDSFDAVTIVFGVRYLPDPVATLRQLGRVLVAGGRLVVVEFVVPKPSPLSVVASTYFFHVIPHIAPLLGGRSHLHVTLAETTRALGPAENLVRICERAGFVVITRRTMGFGMVAGLVCTIARPE